MVVAVVERAETRSAPAPAFLALTSPASALACTLDTRGAVPSGRCRRLQARCNRRSASSLTSHPLRSSLALATRLASAASSSASAGCANRRCGAALARVRPERRRRRPTRPRLPLLRRRLPRAGDTRQRDDPRGYRASSLYMCAVFRSLGRSLVEATRDHEPHVEVDERLARVRPSPFLVLRFRAVRSHW